MYQNQSYNSPYYNGYYGADAGAGDTPAAGFIDKLRGWAARAHSSDALSMGFGAAMGAYSYFLGNAGILGSVAWAAIGWGGYRIATALIAGEKLGTEPIFSLGLMGAGAAFLAAQRYDMIPSFGMGNFDLFDDYSEDWG